MTPLPVRQIPGVYHRKIGDIAHFGDGERRFHAMVSRYFARS
jgi:hypothetical protein